jgi:hypothetical protein
MIENGIPIGRATIDSDPPFRKYHQPAEDSSVLLGASCSIAPLNEDNKFEEV